MRKLSVKRHLACLLIGTQLMGCSAGARGIAGDSGDWAPPVPPAPQPLAMRPNFYAPSAPHCARPVRTRELPGAAGQAGANEGEGWAPPSDARTSGLPAARPEGVLGRLLERASGRSREEAVAHADAAPASPAVEGATPASAMAAKSGAPALGDHKRMAAQSGFAAPAPMEQRQQQAVVTAGVVDDNANFGEYLAFRNRTQVVHRPVDVSERYLLQVKDGSGRGVPDAEVRVQSPSGSALWARTDAGGQVWVSPNAFDASRASTYQVSVRKPGRWGSLQATGFLQRGQKSAVEVRLDGAPQARAQLDLVFLIDATGSMGDEIDKLKASVRTIANEVAQLPARPDLCFGLVAYRDRGDAFLIRSHDFTNDLGAFQGALNQLQAGGGGDYPEAMNEALHDTVHSLSWRGNGTTRMVFLIADAPPHLDYGGPQYDQDMAAALGKGIKIFGVGASGLDKQGEYVQRQMAQYSGGKFVFLTYAQAHNPASGAGRETVHDVQNYGVDTLDRLIVRLVREDLAKLGRSGG